MPKIFLETYNCSLGQFHITCSEKGIKSIQRATKKVEVVPHNFIGQAKKELNEYFEGKRKKFTVPLDIDNGTIFQKSVWSELLKIPFGSVYSYSQIALLCGNINKVRAVGKANSANPIPIIIPCHRVIGKDGKLIGYSQGIDMKKHLLQLEKAPIMKDLFF